MARRKRANPPAHEPSPPLSMRGDFLRLADVRSTLRALDGYEGMKGFLDGSNLFDRTCMYVSPGDARQRLAWVYISGPALAEGSLIESGDWRAHTHTREPFLDALVGEFTAVEPEEAIARRLVALDSWLGRYGESAIRRFLPLWRALAEGTITEWDLRRSLRTV